MVKKNRKPQFFKFFLPGVNDERLMIPLAFLKHMEGRRSGSASLIGPSGNIWHVDLIENNRGAFLQNGWAEFARDHYVCAGYCLVFRYEGNLQFTVTIFDESACEKEDAVRAKTSHDSASYKNEKKMETPALTSKCKLEKCIKKKCQSAGQRHFYEKTVRSTNLHTEKMLHELKSSCFKENKAMVKLKKKQVFRHYKGSCVSQRRPVTKEEIDRAYADAMFFTSENPRGVIVMRKAYCYFGFYLQLPKSFPLSAMMRATKTIILYDPSGKPWETKFLYIKDRGAGAFSAGWKAFAVGNNLEEHDVCVFEVIKSNEIHVHIFRVVDEITPRLCA
ncbi:B3 domain-containing protein Os11g0197600-like isoform X2 [Aristolochia californica]|uniref:B3 domain-containing protein Os11g0197600-like isoform X2 n=1 Tax=Aristolochia californica TaxID=171875 RepID=UPI0035E3AD76